MVRSIRNLGTKGGTGLVAAAFVLLVVLATVLVTSCQARAEDPTFGRPHTWTGEQSIRTDFVFKSASPSGKDGGTIRDERFLVPYDTANSRFTIKGTEGRILEIDVTKCVASNGVHPASYGGVVRNLTGANANSAGATVYLPTVTAALDGAELKLVNKVTSTVTPFILYGTGINGGGSGSTTFTNNPYKLLPMRAGDYITVRAQFKSGVSWQITDWGITGEAYDGEYLTGTTSTGFTISGVTSARVFYINPANTHQVTSFHGSLGVGVAADAHGGVSVHIPTPTKELDGVEITIVNMTSGTSEIVPYCAGLPIGSTSGVSPGAALSSTLLDAGGDSITLRAAYNSGISWFVKGAYIR